MGITERPGMRDARTNRTSAYLRKGGADFFGGRFNGLPVPLVTVIGVRCGGRNTSQRGERP